MSDDRRPAPAPDTHPATTTPPEASDSPPARQPVSRPPPTMGTLESALYADNLDAAEVFWTQVMGLTAFQRKAGRHVFFRVADGPPVQVLLVFNPAATEAPASADPGADAGPDAAPDALAVPPHGARGPGHYCLAVSAARLDDWCSHLTAMGVAIEADIAWPAGGRSVYVRDPAGNSIELADPALWA